MASWKTRTRTTPPAIEPGAVISALPRLVGTDPPGCAQCPRWVARRSAGGGGAWGHAMNDSSDVLALLAAAVPAGPREHELCSVAFLARAVQAWNTGMPARFALMEVRAALRGFGGWKGKSPAALKVYVRGYLGDFSELSRKEIDPGDGGPPMRSDFETRFSGASDMNEFFVLWSDAQRAFVLEPPARSVQTSAPALAEPTAAAEPVPLHLVQPEPERATAPAPAAPKLKRTKEPGEEWQPADHVALLDQYEQLKATGTKTEVAHRLLSEAWGFKPNSVKAFLVTARKPPLRKPKTRRTSAG